MCLFDLCRIEGSTLAALTARVQKLEAMLAGQMSVPQAVPLQQYQPVPQMPAMQEKTVPAQYQPVLETVTQQPKFGYVAAEEHGIQFDEEPQQKALQQKTAPAEPVSTQPKQPAPPKTENTPKATFTPAPAPQGDAAAAEELWQQVLEILKSEKKRSMVACAAGAQPLFHQYLPQLGTGAPQPLHHPQR